jgi:hypothetical protein
VRRRSAAAAAASAIALALGGCDVGGGSSPSTRDGARTTRPPQPREEIQALLDRRADALESGDVAGYARTAIGVQRSGDRRAARIAARMPLRDVALRIRSADVDGDRARLRLTAAYGLEGVRGTFTADPRATAVRRGRAWRIETVRGGRGSAPWEVADYAARRLEHFVLLAPRELPVDALDLPNALADGYGLIRQALPRAPLRRRYLVVVAPTADAARRLTVDIRGIEGLAAISDTAVRESGPAQRVASVMSQRLLIVWPGFTALGGDERRRVVAHELTHAVLAAQTSGRTPSWLVEGIALYVSGDDRRDQVGAVLAGQAGPEGSEASTAFTLRGLSSPDAIARLDGNRQSGAYAWASAAAFTMAERHGRRSLLRLYDAFNDEALLGRPGPALTGRALRRVTGEGIDALEEAMRAGLS